MGSGCSSGEDAKHHRENYKNRINPTETYDKWQQKMLLDVSADPLAVIRDFPRMTIFVHTDTGGNSSPEDDKPLGNGAHTIQSWNPQQQGWPRQTSDTNPLTGRKGSQSHRHRDANLAKSTTGSAKLDRASEPPHGHSSRKKKKSNATLPSDSLMHANTDSSGTWVSPMESPVLLPRPPPNPGTGCGARNRSLSAREPHRDSDAFAARMQRVREAVVLLSELCNERRTFGAAFEKAWDRLVMRGSSVSRSTNNMESDAVSDSTTGAAQDGLMPSFSKKSRNHSVALDVHQVLLNACVESGMLVNSEDITSAPTVPAPLHDLAAKYDISQKPPRGSEQQQENWERGVNITSNVHAPIVRGDSNALVATTSPATTYITTPTRYTVRSATFHLMQFTTQGVVFFPVQRLKHVLWMPWASHMQDVAWSVHFSIKEATPADLIARKQHQLDTLCNTSTSQLSTHVDSAAAAVVAAATAVAAAGGVDGRRVSLSAPLGTTVGTDACEWRLPAVTSTDATKNSTRKTHRAALGNNECRGMIILIQHVQTGRHYVEENKRKTTPRYELDWACSIQIDQNTLSEMFAPNQESAASAKDVASASTPAPLSPLCDKALDSKINMPTTTSATHPHRRPNDDEDQRTVNGEVQSSNTGSDDFSERARPHKPMIPSAVAFPPPLLNTDVGMRTTHQSSMPHREVIHASVEVVAARVEKPPRTFHTVSSTWRKRKEELDYVLQQQYNVRLEQVNQMPERNLY